MTLCAASQASLAGEEGCEKGPGHADSGRVFSHSRVFQMLVQCAVAYGVFKVGRDGQVTGLGYSSPDDGFSLLMQG
jgi:hypothetical protein